jgi:dynein assembly factor 2
MYEQEIAALEAEKGNNVQFINPEPGFVIKTFLTNEKKERGLKLFINVCYSEKIEQAASKVTMMNGRRGQNWSIPYSLGSKRDDLDHGI